MKKFLAVLLAFAMTAALLTGCSGGSGNNQTTTPGGDGTAAPTQSGGDTAKGGSIRVWVGEESAEYYEKACKQYLADHPDFGYTIEVKGMDTGSIAGVITTDPAAAADIYTVAHDNIGKLAASQCAKPITDQSLIDQVLADNPAAYQGVIYSLLDGQKYLYGVPYISQALVLYYNKALVTEEQAKTFEGLREAAAAANAKAIIVKGDDGYNNSFALLARNVKDKSTTVKIYEGAEAVAGGSKGTSYCQGDDTIAIFRWLQRYYEDPNGFKWASPDGWEKDMKNQGALAIIGGAWQYKAAAAALGESNLGITLIPTFTLTEEDVQGLKDVKAGDTYRGGTFADCKCFMINATSDASKYVKEQELIKYLSSKEIQNESYLEAMNVPAYAGSGEFIKSAYDNGTVTESEYNLAAMQVEMSEWGIPQPFLTGTLNTYYYSKNAPQIFRAIIEKSKYPSTGDVILQETETLEGIRKALYLIEYIWMHGTNPKEFPASYPAETK